MTLIRPLAVAVGVLAFVLGARAPLLSQPRTLVSHDFEASAQGWYISGDTGAVDPQRHAADGDPGGYISHADEAMGETWYFSAPASVLAALGAAEHGSLTYSLRQSEPVVGIFEDDVVITGPAGRLSYRFPSSPGTHWTSFSVSFTAKAGWRWNWNRPATQAQIRSVLADPTSLEIRGEYHTGPDEGALDSVVLTAGR